MNIYLIGHKSPDLDAIASPIAYAQFLEKIKRYEGANLIPVRADDINRETEYVLNKLGITTPKHLNEYTIEPTDAFILCDHNEISQRHENIPENQVIEIIDHHKINVGFTSPIRIDVKPVGSTCSVIYEQFEMYGVAPTDKVKSLILTAILSDTQGLKSATTTGYDSTVAHKLAKELNQDIQDIVFNLFKAKSDITGMNATQIAKKDYKLFNFGGKTVFINQVETVEPEKVLEMKQELINALSQIKAEEGAGLAFIVVTDILNVNSRVIAETEEELNILEKAFTTEARDNVADIGPRMSRKKEIAPAIEKVLTENK